MTSRHFSLIQKALCETHNYGLGRGEDSGAGGKEKKQRRRVGGGGGKDRRRAVTWTVAILREEEGVLIGGIEFGRYNRITHYSFDIAFSLNVSLTSVTRMVEKILGNDDILSATLEITEEEAEKYL